MVVCESAQKKVMPQTSLWHAHGAEIEELMRQGMSMAEIARRFGVSRERIRALLASHRLATRAPMLNRKEAAALLGCCGAFLTGLEQKGLISSIHSGPKHAPVYYPESEVKKISAIMDRKGMGQGRQKKSMVVVT
jgi:DNA-binding CsgD family transcriptional regulator